MKANETTFQHVIEGTKQYIVPLFQRPYCWDKSQWETLWNDLVEMQDAARSRSHFIGSIVTLQTQSVRRALGGGLPGPGAGSGPAITTPCWQVPRPTRPGPRRPAS